jgi:hypothetical protein
VFALTRAQKPRSQLPPRVRDGYMSRRELQTDRLVGRKAPYA